MTAGGLPGNEVANSDVSSLPKACINVEPREALGCYTQLSRWSPPIDELSCKMKPTCLAYMRPSGGIWDNAHGLSWNEARLVAECPPGGNVDLGGNI